MTHESRESLREDAGGARVPSPATPLVGRRSELAAVHSLLGRERLVTVVGVGGAGKTRLALEVAHGWPDAAFVDLSPLSSADLMLPGLARAVGLREAGAVPVVETLYRYLSTRAALLVVDNLEHVLDAAADLVDLLERCPDVRVLATSRVPLRVPGEHLVVLRPLPLPGAITSRDRVRLLAVPSVALVVARLRAAVPDLEVTDEVLDLVAELCEVLDGLPLALELAVAQVRALGLAEVIERARAGLDDGCLPPRRGVPQRHRSLDAAITWSVARLSALERQLFARLTVFAGGFSAAAAQQVCGEPGRDVRPVLATLVEHSLVEAAHDGGAVRYRMLDTLRRHAAGLLAEASSDAGSDVGDRLLAWCSTVAAAVSEVPVADESRWFDVAEAEWDNLRTALEACPPERTELGLQIAADLYFFWDIRGYLGEGVRHLRRLLARQESHDVPQARARALQSLGLLLVWRDDPAGADAALREAADLAERLGDRGGWAWCAGSLAIAHFVGGDVSAVAVPAEQGLRVAREVGTWMPLLRATCGLGLVRWAQGRYEEARALMIENARLAEPSWWGVGKANWFLGWFAFLENDLDEAERLFRTGMAGFEAVGDRRSLPDCHDGVACVAAERGDALQALELLSCADRLRARSGSRRSAYLTVHCDRARTRARAGADSVAASGLTRREHQVAVLIAQGMTNRQIGRHLGISERTAERHVENLRTKLDVRSRTQIATWAAALPTTDTTLPAGITHTAPAPPPVD